MLNSLTNKLHEAKVYVCASKSTLLHLCLIDVFMHSESFEIKIRKRYLYVYVSEPKFNLSSIFS